MKTRSRALFTGLSVALLAACDGGDNAEAVAEKDDLYSLGKEIVEAIVSAATPHLKPSDFAIVDGSWDDTEDPIVAAAVREFAERSGAVVGDPGWKGESGSFIHCPPSDGFLGGPLLFGTWAYEKRSNEITVTICSGPDERLQRPLFMTYNVEVERLAGGQWRVGDVRNGGWGVGS